MKEEDDNIILNAKKNRESWFKRVFNTKNYLALSIIGIIIILLFFVWTFGVNKYQGCTTWECFNEHLAACKEAKFAGGKDVIFGYIIEGQEGDECIVHVEFLQGEITDRTARNLIGEKMTCRLPNGIILLPESNLERCSGPLKEKLQEQIIEQLHNFIVQNLGQINKELLDPLNYQTNSRIYG